MFVCACVFAYTFVYDADEKESTRRKMHQRSRFTIHLSHPIDNEFKMYDQTATNPVWSSSWWSLISFTFGKGAKFFDAHEEIEMLGLSEPVDT